METKRKALGKGLEQLFSNEVINFEDYTKDIVSKASSSDITLVSLDDIRSNPYQPRKTFNDVTLKELADSILENGVIEPIIVKKSIKGYELVAGERRTRAARLAGLKTIPAIVKDFSDQQMMEVALLENIQREDLNPIEEANAYQNIITYGNLTQEEFAKKFGKSRSHVTNILGLLSLPSVVKDMLLSGQLSMGHGRALSKISDDDVVIMLANRVVKENLSVRSLESLISSENLPKKKKQERTDAYVVKHRIYEKYLADRLKSKVKIMAKKIEISYSDEADLEALLEELGVRIEGI